MHDFNKMTMKNPCNFTRQPKEYHGKARKSRAALTIRKVFKSYKREAGNDTNATQTTLSSAHNRQRQTMDRVRVIGLDYGMRYTKINLSFAEPVRIFILYLFPHVLTKKML